MEGKWVARGKRECERGRERKCERRKRVREGGRERRKRESEREGKICNDSETISKSLLLIVLQHMLQHWKCSEGQVARTGSDSNPAQAMKTVPELSFGDSEQPELGVMDPKSLVSTTNRCLLKFEVVRKWPNNEPIVALSTADWAQISSILVNALIWLFSSLAGGRGIYKP